jgi:riboflavin kinase/FMN adenylyltransferase
MLHIIIGHDYAFGRNREGSFQTLSQLGKDNGFTLEDLPPIGEEGFVFSSSLVRSAVADGDMVAAARILGRYFLISGKVVHGREVGHLLGFPTANIATSNELLPPDGVYAVMVMLDGQCVKGACNIGCNPTFGENARSIEVFLLDYSGNLYDHDISLQFVQKLRSEQKFTGLEALKSAISRDVEQTRTVLEKLDDAYLKLN